MKIVIEADDTWDWFIAEPMNSPDYFEARRGVEAVAATIRKDERYIHADLINGWEPE